MKIPFNIKYRPQIESDEYKVETKDGKQVRIVSWDKNGFECKEIVALVTNATGTESCNIYTIDGLLRSNSCQKNMNLFIVTPEEELTEFEQEVSDIVEYCKENGEHVAKGYAKRHAKTLLSFAEKELAAKYKVSSDMNSFAYRQGYKTGMEDALKERSRNITANLLDSKITGIQHELIQFTSNIMEAGWKDIIETSENYAQRIRAQVLKDIPRWKRFTPNVNDTLSEQQICKELENSVLRVDVGGYCWVISREDLNKLPKEDEK